MSKPQQLLLDLPLRPAMGRDDFLVTSSNVAAVRLIDEWPNWPAHGAILIGPRGSGKTHLSQVWQKKSNARSISMAELHTQSVAENFTTKALVLEDAAPSKLDQTALFHTLNHVLQQAGHVLLTSAFEPTQWAITLPDLASRLGALPIVHILPPDDALLRGVLVKLFTDRQINVDESLISFALSRMPRELQAAQILVNAVDHQAMQDKAEVTRSFVAKIIGDIFNPSLFNHDD